MTNLRRTAFRVGCYLAMVTAAIHMVGYVVGMQGENESERALLEQATNYHFTLPGGASRSLMDLMDGFSLIFPLFLASTGGLGLIVARRASADPVLTGAVVRTLAGAYLVAVVISVAKFFIVPTACLAAVAICFVFAAAGARETS